MTVSMTNQEAMDKMIQHLQQLPHRSLIGNSCTYNGLKCAVGCLMTDKEQVRFGEYMGCAHLLLKTMKEYGHVSHLYELDINMLTLMQNTHDNEHNWDKDGFFRWDKVRKICKRYNLNSELIDTITNSSRV